MALPQDLSPYASEATPYKRRDPPAVVVALLRSTVAATSNILRGTHGEHVLRTYGSVLVDGAHSTVAAVVDKVYGAYVLHVKAILGSYGYGTEAAVMAGNVRDGAIGGGKHTRHVLAAAQQ